jgi:hypothetical protein
MNGVVEVDVWVRGTLNARTHHIESLPDNPDEWHEGDVRRLLSEMLLALEREKNPGGLPPEVRLRGFSWIVSPYDTGVLVHLEMQMGTASAGPLAADADRLTALLTRIMNAESTPVVH